MSVAIRRLFGIADDAQAGGSEYDQLAAGAIPDASIFWPVTGGSLDKNIEQTNRNDEVRGRRAGSPPRPFRAGPVLTVPVPAYLSVLKKALKKALGGTDVVTGSVAAGFTHNYGILGFGATDLPAVHAQLVRDDHNDKAAGCVYNRLSMTFPLDGEGTTEHELWAKYVKQDPAAPPSSVYTGLSSEPLMLRDARVWIDGANEVQTITVGTGTTAFTLGFDGATTTSLTGTTATAAQVKTALEALATIGVGNVDVTGATGGPFTVTFKNALGGRNVAQISTASNTGGVVTTATSTAGGVALPNLQGFEFAFVNNLSRKWYAMRNRVVQSLGSPASDHMLWWPAENKLGAMQDVTFAVNFGDVDTAADLAHDFRQIRKYVFECYGQAITGSTPGKTETLRVTIYNGVFQSGGPEAMSARDDLTARYEGNAFYSEADAADVKVEVLDGVAAATT